MPPQLPLQTPRERKPTERLDLGADGTRLSMVPRALKAKREKINDEKEDKNKDKKGRGPGGTKLKYNMSGAYSQPGTSRGALMALVAGDAELG